MESLKIFFAENFQNMIWFAVFIIAILPITESRVAFPFAINQSLLKKCAMHPLLAILTCTLASMFLCLFLLFFFNNIIKKLNKYNFFSKLNTKLESTIKNKSKKFENSRVYFLLFLFVLIPLPLTGVWTASLIASFLKLDNKKSFVSIILGNIFSILLIYALSLFFRNQTLIIILIAFAITFIFLIIKKLFYREIKTLYIKDN